MKKFKYIIGIILICLFCCPTISQAKYSWSTVFKNGLISNKKSTESSIAVSASGKIYVAYQDGGKYARVKVFNGSAWSDVADGSHPNGILSSDKGGNPNLAVNGETVYVAFEDYAHNKNAKIMKWDGSSWTEVSDEDHANGYLTTAGALEPTLAIDHSGENLYVVFADQSQNNRPRVMRYTSSNNWETVADENIPDGYLSAASAFDFALTPSKVNDDIFVAFEDYANGNRIHVYQWNGTSWADLGLVSNYDAYSPSVATDSAGNVYLVYTSQNNNNTNKYPIGNLKRKEAKTFIHKWNGSSWSLLGNGLVSNSKTIESFVTVDQRNYVYVAFSEHKKNFRINKKRKTFWRVKVKIWNGNKWIAPKPSKSNPYVSSGSGKGDPAIVTFGNKLYICFTDAANGNRVRVKSLIYP